MTSKLRATANGEDSTIPCPKNEEEEMPLCVKEDMAVAVENKTNKVHIYGVNDSPPLHITVISGLQVLPSTFFFTKLITVDYRYLDLTYLLP